MNPEAQQKLLSLIAEAIKGVKSKPLATEGMPGEKPAAKISEKKPVQKPEQRKPAAKTAEGAPKKPAEPDLVRKAFVEAGIADGKLPTTAEKMSVLLSQTLQKKIDVEDVRLKGLISRLQGGDGRQLNWDEPSEETWRVANDIVRTPIRPRLSEADQIIFDELRQGVGEYYYRYKDFFEKHNIRLKANPDDHFFDGVYERMQEDEFELRNERFRAEHTAATSHPENTKGWAQDIEKQILEEGKPPPEATITVAKEEANDAIQNTIKVSKEFEWLVKDGEIIDDPQVAQVIYDIVSGDTTPSKEMLLVKGSQLKHGRGLDEGKDESPERRKFRQRLLKKVQQSYGFSEDPRKAGSGATPEQKQLFEAITHEVSGFESGMAMPLPTPGTTQIWDRVTPSGNTLLDKLLLEIQNEIDNDPFNAQSPRYLFNAKAKLTGFNRAELDAVGGPDRKLQALRKDAERGMIESWSSISVEPKTQEMFILYPRAAVDEYASNIEGTSDIWAEGPFSDAQTYGLRRLGEFLSSGEFQGKIKDYMLAHQDAIESAYGPMDTNNLEVHPFYVGRVDNLKEVSDDINSRSALQRAYGAKKSGLELAKQQQAQGALGDLGQLRIKAGHGGVNHVAYEFYNTTLRHFQQNFHTGLDDRITGEEQDLARKLTEKFILKNKNVLEPVFQKALEPEVKIDDAPKINRELNPLAAKKIAREVSMLSSVTGEEESAMWGGQSPGENDGQNMKPKGFSATTGTEVGLRGRAWFRWWEDRWDLIQGSAWQNVRNEADMYAKALGIDTNFDQIMRKIKAKTSGDYRNDPDYKALARQTFGIVEQDPVKRAGIEAARLNKMFSKTLDWKDRKPPTSLDSITEDFLKEAYMFKWGIHASEAMTGHYGYEASYMYFNEVITLAEYTWGHAKPGEEPALGDLIAIEHRIRKYGNDLLGAETEHDIESAIEGLIGDHGALRLAADLLPHRQFGVLMKHKNIDMRAALHDMAADGVSFTGPFSVRTGIDYGQNFERWDLLEHELEQRYLLIDMLNAAEGLKPYDYHLDVGQNNPRVLRNIIKACGGADEAKAYLTAMKALSTHVRQESYIRELVKGEYLDYYRITTGETAHIKYLDDPLTAPGNVFTALTPEERELRFKKLSTQMGGQFGQGPHSIIGRWGGDSGVTTDNAMQIQYPMHGATSEKDFLEKFGDLMEKSKFVGGLTPKNRIGAMTVGAWLKTVQTDRWKDILLLGSLPNSSGQKRAVGDKGLSLGLNESYHVYEQAQAIAKIKFKDAIPELNSSIEQQLGFIWKIRKPGGGYWEPIAPVWMYRFYLFGLIGVILVANKVKEEAQKGFSGDSSGGGGGSRHG